MNFIEFRDNNGAIKTLIRVEHITMVKPLPEYIRGPDYTRIFTINGNVDVSETIDKVVEMIAESK